MQIISIRSQSDRPMTTSNSILLERSLVIIVDPYSTGCMVAQEISTRGYSLMA